MVCHPCQLTYFACGAHLSAHAFYHAEQMYLGLRAQMFDTLREHIYFSHAHALGTSINTDLHEYSVCYTHLHLMVINDTHFTWSNLFHVTCVHFLTVMCKEYFAWGAHAFHTQSTPVSHLGHAYFARRVHALCTYTFHTRNLLHINCVWQVLYM